MNGCHAALSGQAFANCTALETLTGSVKQNSSVSYFSETAPTAAGPYWHFDAAGHPVLWK